MHTHRERTTLLNRVRRIRGQMEKIERMLETEHDCEGVLQQIAACRGAINGLMVQVLDGHIREHVIDPERKPTRVETQALDALAQLMKSYLK